ncbi:conserved hypothetical protein; putative exported protein [Xenorhabdus bovienii str. Jollieti]|uniref:Lipoprotein n=1 Tax=Xenorhabdus bovienii (strain SS-2004) TaxID=406818 RepID=D3UYE9_XENBS|nr:hypothetical protein [Xenorhabdus bovienii]CBJ79327.1 conserved hypothetical protein; putative exported protein [Xenorhabdus bovienii SS-2004]CDH30169.1 conserved hypothetical protein; putative exported protein [Xenorhabdus bovienii str. Jollieti]
MKFLCNKSAFSSLLAVFFIQGCAQSDSFSPPMNGENIHFTATMPDELDALPISAMYRSEICRKERRTANMKSYSVPGFHRATYPLSIGQPNQVEVSVPKEGGGKCDWKLSNLTFEVKLKDTSTIAPLIKNNFGFKTTFVIDGNAPQEFDGGYLKINGNLHEKIILFPLLTKLFLSVNETSFYLIGKGDPLTYKVGATKNINLSYIYIKKMLSVWTDRKNNDRPFMTYPNGDIVYGEVRPEYEILMRILESRNSK